MGETGTRKTAFTSGAQGTTEVTVGVPQPGSHQPRRRRAPWIVGGVAAGVLAIAAGVLWYSSGHVSPGVTYAGQAVGGSSTAELASALSTTFDEHRVTLSLNGTSVEAAPADLGLSIDAEATARQLIAAHPAWNPTSWNAEDATQPVVHADDAALAAFIDSHWPNTDTVVEPSLRFDASTAAFTVVPGHAGTTVDRTDLQNLVLDSFVEGQAGGTHDVPLATVDPSVDEAAAQQGAADASALVKAVTFTADDGTTVTAAPGAVAGWVRTEVTGNQLTSGYDQQAVQSYLTGTLAKKVNVDVRNEEILVAGDTRRTVAQGRDGRTLSDTEALSADIVQGLPTGTTQFSLAFDVQQYASETVSRWIDVNLETRVVNLYQDGAVIKTFPMSPGVDTHSNPGGKWASDAGEFKVWYKTVSQTMVGFDNGVKIYETPNVQWVTYYNGDEAFHAAPWNNAIGVEDRSHGCLNMYTADAKFVYDFAPIGTRVSVHY